MSGVEEDVASAQSSRPLRRLKEEEKSTHGPGYEIQPIIVVSCRCSILVAFLWPRAGQVSMSATTDMMSLLAILLLKLEPGLCCNAFRNLADAAAYIEQT